MRFQSKAVLLVALAVVATAATPLAAGALTATQQDVTQSTQTQVDDNRTEAEDNETDAEEPDDGTAAEDNETDAEEPDDGADTDSETQSFDVVSVSASNSTAPNSTVTVIAYVENPNSMAAAQEIEFRVGGDVVDRERIDVDAGETEAVGFSLDTTGLDLGQYDHSVFTLAEVSTAN
jgi:Ni/Co efflux regulator RcnB